MGGLTIIIQAECPPTPEGYTLAQSSIALLAEEAGSIRRLEQRLNDALANLYDVSPEAKVKRFICMGER
jgi:hypothetical protein